MVEEGKLYDILILGGGPAGLAAAIYAGRSKLSVAVVERGAFGGAIVQASEVANYPGGMVSETGLELAARMEAQVEAHGAERIIGTVTKAVLGGNTKEVSLGENVYTSRSVIIATGISSRLGIKGEEEFTGLGLSYCAECDGPFFAGRDVFVVGGGSNALEESLYLASIARQVTVIHRRGSFQAGKQLIEKAEAKGNISFLFDTEVTAVGGDGLLTRIETRNAVTGVQDSVAADEGENFGVFVFAGARPQSGIFEEGLEKKDGYIVTDEEMRTNIPGVFAAGDVRHKALRQAVTAAADGAVAAVSAGRYLLKGEKGGK